MAGMRTIDELVAEARVRLDRVSPTELAAEQAAGALVVDIRNAEQRQRDGELAGAAVVDRNVLEWRLDRACPHRMAEATGCALRVIVVCNEGSRSRPAAAALQDLGLPRATDPHGGFPAWLAALRP